MLRLQFFSLQTGQRTQSHIHDCLCLRIGKFKSGDQSFLCNLCILAASDNGDHFVDVIHGNQKTLQNVISFLCLVQIIFGSSGHNIFLVIQIVNQHIQKVHHLGLVIDQGKHDNTEGVLKLRVLIEEVQHNIGVGVPAQLNYNTHTFPVGFISKIRDAVYLFQLYQLGNLLDQVCLVYHVGKLCHNDLALAVG